MTHEKKRNKMKKVLAGALLASILTGCASAGATGKAADESLLKTAVLKIGKADAIVVWQASHAMIIDCGEEEDGQEILEFLAKQEIDHIEAMIITHFDKDHVGGADTVIENIPTDRILMPDYEGSVTDYADFIESLESTGMTAERLRESVSFSLGDALVTVDPPLDYSITAKRDADSTYEIDNNLSLITTVVHGNNRLLFMGDAEKARTKEFLTTEAAVDCDFVKLPHHGVYSTSLDDLMDAVTPEYVAICDSSKNPASTDTLQMLKDKGITVRQTMAGRITVVSDGDKIDIQQKTR